MDMPARALSQPPFDTRVLVGAVVSHDQVDVEEKLYCRIGAWPFRAQVRALQGLSDRPHSSMKTITRPCRAAIF